MSRVSEMAGSIKKKVTTLMKILKIVNMYSKTDINLSEERQKYGASHGYLVAVVLEDAGLVVYSWVDDNGMNFRLKKPESREPDVVVYTDIDTILNAFDGRIKVLDQRTGKEKYVSYSFVDAVNLGHIRGEGPELTNMFAMSARVWDDHINRIRSKINKVRDKQ